MEMYFKQNMAKEGYLELIIGPMFSGKTSSLVDLWRMYELSSLNTCVINYAEDTRYGDASDMYTHDKKSIPCISTLTIAGVLTPEVIGMYDVFLINEGQFFDDIYTCVKELVEEHNKIVHVCGLDGDFKRNGFSELLRLIPICNNIVKKSAICMKCKNGTRALFSHRVSKEDAVKVIGSDNYIPVCRSCYLELNKKKTIEDERVFDSIDEY